MLIAKSQELNSSTYMISEIRIVFTSILIRPKDLLYS